MKRADLFFKQFIAFLLILNVIAPVFGQTRRAPAKVSTTSVKQPAPKCAGGWRGIVNFKKTLKDSFESDEPGIRKSIDRIKHKTSRNYAYTGRAVVDGTKPPNTDVSTKVDFTDTDLKWGQEKVFDSCNSKENGHWFIIEGTDDRQTQAQASGAARSFNLSVNEMAGIYGFSLQFPAAQGTFKREEHVRRSGHCQAKNNEPYDRSTNEPTKIDGESFSIDGEKIDPKSPDTLKGVKIWGDDGRNAVKGFIYEVSWYFTRCPGDLVITDFKFEHPKFPSFEEWKEIHETIGTIDGNRVKIKTKVLNLSVETKYADLRILETYKGDKFNGARPDEPLPEGEISLRLEAGEEREFELIWDSEGQAWFDDGRPHQTHRLKASLTENNVKKDEEEKPLNIAPKPLVLVNGVWSSHEIWEPLYQNLLTQSHSYQWKAYPVGASNKFPLGNGNAFLSGSPAVSIYENADRLAKFVRYVQEDANAWHVDMAAHSTGGLVARLYLHKSMPKMPDARPLVKHLTMLGTPNGGIKCADVFAGKLDLFKETLQPIKEFTNDEMLRFNQYVVNTGGTKVSALVGNSVPVICGGFEWNDSFVTIESAKYGISDFAYSNDLHTQLTDAKNFGSFVKPHIVTGPKGTYPLPVKSDPNNIDRWKINSNRLHSPSLQNDFGASFMNTNFDSSITLDDSDRRLQNFVKEIKLSPNQTTEIEVLIETAPNFGITFMANPSVKVTLLNEKGLVIGKNSSESQLAREPFRMVFTNNPVAKSTWKLRLENTSPTEQIFAGFGWSGRRLTDLKASVAE